MSATTMARRMEAGAAATITPADLPAVRFENVDILFGGTRGRASIDRALGLLDSGRTRAEILAETGTVIGVAGASLSVRAGEIAVLMGLSGSGKSTLLRAANGLNKVTRGKVLLRDGKAAVDVASCDAATLRRMRGHNVAMVFQQFALLPWRTVRENVGLGLELRGMSRAERRAIVDEKLKLVALDAWADRYASELSGGMQQRVGLARAFATDADILLMDEPFSALDPLIRTKLQDELLELQRRLRKTILFVSHDLDEALKLGNSISILEGGRIIQTGTAEDIVLRPADDYVAEFVRHMNPLSFLRGYSVMRVLSALPQGPRGVQLDAEGRFHLLLDGAGTAVSTSVDGAPHRFAEHDEDLAGLPMMSVETPLRSIIRRHQATGQPVVLFDQGAVVGVCSGQDILRALDQGQAG